jgi:hypothetical protein
MPSLIFQRDIMTLSREDGDVHARECEQPGWLSVKI